jgi:L-ascorbate metabolism protein UlaG (beta-lactamase superfamily)
MAANAIGPRVAIPMHWGKVVGGREDAEAFVEACEMPAFVLEVYSPEAGNEPEPRQEEN